MLNLDEYLKNYSGAWDGVSFDPEKRFDSFKKDLSAKIKKIEAAGEAENVDSTYYVNKLLNLACKFLGSKSRCVSSMIAGPAGFPTERMNKRAEWAEAWYWKYTGYADYAVERIKKRNVVKVSQTEKANQWSRRADKLEQLQNKMKYINNLIRKGKDSELIELVGEAKAESLKTPDFCGRVGYPDYELRNNLANIKRLRAQAKQVENLQARNEDEFSFEFDGGRVEYDSEEIRFNIFFDEKPEEEQRNRLKHNGFKWSPKRVAWTRGAKTISLKTVKSLVM